MCFFPRDTTHPFTSTSALNRTNKAMPAQLFPRGGRVTKDTSASASTTGSSPTTRPTADFLFGDKDSSAEAGKDGRKRRRQKESGEENLTSAVQEHWGGGNVTHFPGTTKVRSEIVRARPP